MAVNEIEIFSKTTYEEINTIVSKMASKLCNIPGSRVICYLTVIRYMMHSSIFSVNIEYFRSLFIILFTVFGAILIVTASLSFVQLRVLPVGEENESEMDVHYNNDWSNHEKSLEHAAWKNWALV